ncbi:MAG: translation initiation factor eIF-2B [Candidatus Dojkabacteria bacterium]|jgi:ribose 1,5-bisphosphate isomerase
MQKYPEIEKIYNDIQKLNIQGATNVCISTFEGMKLYLKITKESDPKVVKEEFFRIGSDLAHARENEPLARNGVTFVKYFFEKEFTVLPSLNSMKQRLDALCDQYLDMVESSKRELIDIGTNNLYNFDKILTHCHSSTAVSLIKSLGKGDRQFEVVCTETRPLFQGRKTAKSLLEARIKTTMIADSAAESFVIGRGSSKVEAVLIGCDEIISGGHAINKIGSWGIAMAAHYAGIPLYVVTPLLKLDEESDKTVKIEVRESKELWKDAPKGLVMYNPAFEIIDNMLIAGYVTEIGIIKPQDLERETELRYPWVFENVKI